MQGKHPLSCIWKNGRDRNYFDSSKEHGEKSVYNGNMDGNMGKCAPTPSLANMQCPVPSPETIFIFSSPDTT